MKRYYSLFPAIALLIVGISLTFWFHNKYKKVQLDVKKKEIYSLIKNESSAIQNNLVNSFSSVEVLKYLFENEEGITKSEFSNYTIPLLTGNPGIKALSWIPKITLEERTDFENRLSLENNRELIITQHNSVNQSFPAQERPYYFPVKYIEPLDENSEVLGYDIYSSGSRKAAINRSIEQSTMLISSGIKLAQDTSGYGYLGLIPVYHSNYKNIGEHKTDSLKGLISAVFKVNDIVQNTLILFEDSVTNLVIHDVTKPQKIEFIYGDLKLFSESKYEVQKEIVLFKRTWQLIFKIDPEYFKIKETGKYLFLGFAISTLLFLLLLIPTIKQQRIKTLYEKLFQEQKAREITEKNLSEIEVYNASLFSQSPLGLVLITSEGKITETNAAFEKITGWTEKELKNKTENEITPEKYFKIDKERNRKVQKQKQTEAYEKKYFHKNGSLIPVRIQRKLISKDDQKYIWLNIENISYEKQIQNEAIESERRFSELMKSVNLVSLILDMKGNISYCNDFLLKKTGYVLAEVIGKNWFEIFIPKENSKHIKTVFLDAIIKGNLVSYMENEIVTKNGKRLIIAWNNTILKSADGNKIGIASLGEDITERKQAEMALKENEAKYRSLFDNAPDGILIADTESYYLDANVSMCKLLGLEHNELVGLHATDIVAPVEYDYIDPALKQIISTDEYQREWIFKRKDGSTFIADVMVTNIPDGNLMAIVRDITEKKNNENRIIESQERFSKIFENNPLPTSLSKISDSKITDINHAWCSFMEIERKDALGKTAEELEIIDPKTRSNLREKFLENGELRNIETFITTKKGEVKNILSSIVPISFNNIKYELNIIVDISARKEMQEKIRVSEKLFSSAFQIGPAAMTITRISDGKFLNINQSFCDLFEFERHEVLNQTSTDLKIWTKEERQKIIQQQIKTGGLVNFEINAFSKSGKIINLLFSSNEISLEGQPCLLTTLIDISERKKAEEEIRLWNKELELRVHKRTEQLSIVNNELKDFAYIVSHDLKAPLRAISQLSFWVYNDYKNVLDDAGKEQLQLITNRAKRMDGLIKGILEYSRIGRENLKTENVDVNKIISDIKQSLIIPQNIKLITAENLPVLHGDKTRFTQVFQNLIENAVKYMDKDNGQIKIACSTKNDNWLFEISDNGPGIEEKFFEKIFQIFQTLNARDELEGTGIGLTLVKKIINMYSGEIWLKSEMGKGTTFFFTLPKTK